jgi:hypothetical protein
VEGTASVDRKKGAAVLSVVLVLLFASSFVGLAYSYTPPPTPPSPPAASVVIGQANFTATSSGTGPARIDSSDYIAIDNSGNLWVSDYSQSWIAEFTPPFSNGQKATLEEGSANFTAGGCSSAKGDELCEPSGIAFDPNGNLWAGDSQNASIKEFKAPFSLGESSSLLLGGYYLSSTTLNASTFGPNGLTFDQSGNLWVVDGGFNRVLEFTPPFTNREAASLVIGQQNFTTVSNKNNESMLNSPDFITFDHSGNLWVSDTYDNRVLEFKPPFSNGETASIALGQPTLSSVAANTTQSTLNYPEGLAFDTHGNLWVSDESNDRVMEFVPPFSTGMNATVVIGQTSYFSSGPSFGNSSVYEPKGLAAGPNGNLWVDDSGNNRVLLFSDPASAASTTTYTTFTPTIPPTSTTISPTSTSSSQSASSQPQTTTSVASATSAASASTPSTAVPEFPYQLALASAFTLVLAGVYVFMRRRNGVRI